MSDPKDGVPSFGLVDEGREQAKEVRRAAGNYHLNLLGKASYTI